MDMILVRPQALDLDLVALTDLLADAHEFRDPRRFQHRPPVLDGEHEMVVDIVGAVGRLLDGHTR